MLKPLVVALAIFIASSAHADQLTRVRLGTTKLGAMASIWIATRAGIFNKHGLDVQVTEIPVSDHSVPLLQAKTVDMVQMIPGSAMVAKEAGFDLISIGQNETAGTTAPVSNAIMVQVNSPIRSVADLRGKRISMTTPHGQASAAVREILNRNGVMSDQVQITPVPYTASADLLRSGQIDAAVALDPYTTQITKSGIGRTLSWYMIETIPDQPVGAFWTLLSWAEAHRKEVAAFDDSMREAHAYLLADPARARKAVSDYSGLDPALVGEMPLISWKADVDTSAWQAVADMMFRQGELRQHHDASEYLFKR